MTNSQITKKLVEAIEKCGSTEIKKLLKNLPSEQRECCVNDTQVAKAFLKNFDVAVGNVLFKSGFSLFSCLSSRHCPKKEILKYSIVECPSSDFWMYVCTPGRIKGSDLLSFANISVNTLAHNNWNTNHPNRAAFADFREAFKQNHPKAFHAWANSHDWEIYEALFSRTNKNFSAKDWSFFNSLPSVFWKDTAHPADWSIQYEEHNIPPLLNVVQNVPEAQRSLKKHYKLITDSRKFAQQLSHSPTGKIDDIQLLNEIKPSKRSNVLASIKSLVNGDLVHASLGVSDCEIFTQILLGDFSIDTDLWQNLPQPIKDKLLRSQNVFFQSLPEMLITFGYTAHIPKFMEVDIEKILSTTAVLRETVEYCDEKIHWENLIKTFPRVKTWQDSYGNTLGHWIASSHNANSFISVLKEPSWLKPNKQGCYVRDVLCTTVSEQNLYEYDQYVSQQLAKQEKYAIKKGLGRISVPTAPRRNKI